MAVRLRQLGSRKLVAPLLQRFAGMRCLEHATSHRPGATGTSLCSHLLTNLWQSDPSAHARDLAATDTLGMLKQALLENSADSFLMQ